MTESSIVDEDKWVYDLYYAPAAPGEVLDADIELYVSVLLLYFCANSCSH